MICRACGNESADDFRFCPNCGKQPIAKMVCGSCGKESAEEFKYCPQCGKSSVHPPAVIESPSPSSEIQPGTEQPIEKQAQTISGETSRSNEVGTWVFGTFSVIALLVSIIKGLVPIYLAESAVWAGAAWYWHKKKSHSELAKAVVIVFAALIAIGEVIQIAREFNKPSNIPASQSTDPFGKYQVPPGSSATSDSAYVPAVSPDQTAASIGSMTRSDVAEVEQRAVALYEEKRYTDARHLFEEACDGGEMKGCNYLGYLYAKGLGGPQDVKKAQDVYQRACDRGTLASCASRGSLFQDAGDDDNARRYFQRACRGGVTEACDLLHGIQ